MAAAFSNMSGISFCEQYKPPDFYACATMTNVLGAIGQRAIMEIVCVLFYASSAGEIGLLLLL